MEKLNDTKKVVEGEAAFSHTLDLDVRIGVWRGVNDTWPVVEKAHEERIRRAAVESVQLEGERGRIRRPPIVEHPERDD